MLINVMLIKTCNGTKSLKKLVLILCNNANNANNRILLENVTPTIEVELRLNLLKILLLLLFWQIQKLQL